MRYAVMATFLLVLMCSCAAQKVSERTVRLLTPADMPLSDGGSYVCFYKNQMMFCAPIVNANFHRVDTQHPDKT